MPNLPTFPAPQEVIVQNPQGDASVRIFAESLGKYGAVTETGTTAVTGNFAAIQMIEDTVFTTLTSSNWSGDAMTGVTFKAGQVIYGAFTAFTLTSGKVIAYKAAV
jgi:hypothetical protein